AAVRPVAAPCGLRGRAVVGGAGGRGGVAPRARLPGPGPGTGVARCRCVARSARGPRRAGAAGRARARGMTRSERAALALAVVVAALGPIVVRSASGRADAAHAVLLYTAALGLAVAVGWAAVPSLGQGAFVGVGAYGAAVLRARHGWDPI